MPKSCLVAGVMVLVLAMAGCGGGGGSAGVGSTSSVTGTAAVGDPLSGATITLKDRAGSAKTVVTDSSGNFSLDTSGMTPPFLVRVVSADNTKTFYSVSADSGTSATINVTPLTDLIVRSWYNTLGAGVVDAFSLTPPTPAPPAPTLVGVLSNAIQNVLQLWMNQTGVSGNFNLISSPFVANGGGIDNVLQLTTITFPDSATARVVITNGITTQTSVITYSPSGDNVSISTTTTSGSDNSTSVYNTCVPVATDVQIALEGIKATFTSFRNTVNGKGASLTYVDLAPYLDNSLLMGSMRSVQFARELAYFLKGKTISFPGIAIKSMTTDEADVTFQLSWPISGLTNFMPMEFFFRKVGGSWLISGDQRIALLEVRAAMVSNQGSSEHAPNMVLETNVNALPGSVTNVTVTGGPWSGASLDPGSTNVAPWDDTFTLASFSTYRVDPTGLSGGMPFTFTVTDNDAGVHSYTLPLNAVTTEAIAISGLTGTRIDNAHVGSPQTVSWSLPRTFAIGRIALGAVAYSGDNTAGYNKCDDMGATAAFTGTTSASVTIPASCNGASTFQAEIYLQVYGINGELSTVYYTYTSDGTQGSWVNM